MSNGRVELTRRQWLAASALAVALPAPPAWALETIRQGFQTNIWGMPTYYLLKSGLVVIAQIEQVGRTAQVVTRKDLNLTQVSELKGRKVANQTGSSVGNIFTDVIAPAAGLKKGDFQEVRMDVNNMVAAMAAKTVDAMVNVEPYNEIAVAEGIGTSIMDYSKVDKMPVFMAATPDFVDKS